MKTRYFLIFGLVMALTTSMALAVDDGKPEEESGGGTTIGGGGNDQPSTSNNSGTDTKKIVASKYYVDTLKQNKLGPEATGNAAPYNLQLVRLTDTLGSVQSLYLTGGMLGPLTRMEDATSVGKFVNGGADISESNGINLTDVQNAVVSLQLLRDVYDDLSGQVANTITWSTTGANNDQVGTDNYSTTFSSSGSGNWPSGDRNRLATGNSLANGLSRKQNKMVCADWDDPEHIGNDDYCWMWQVAE